MRNHILGLLLLVLATACSPLAMLRKTPAEKVAGLLAAHPELAAPETVRVAVPYLVPQISFQKELVPVHDTVYVQREASALDSLLARLQGRLDSAQRVATTAQLHRLLLSRPVLNDTLCFDTLGVAGKFWRVGRHYQLQITRAPIAGQAPGAVVVARLQPCTDKAALSRFNPARWGFPWFGWLLIGLVLGLVLGFLICRSLTRRVNA